jgi:hypothetical protein
MAHPVAAGLVAGAAGTAALNVATYLDMAARGRGSSEMPALAARKLADGAGLHLSAGGKDGNRAEGMGALLGYATGLGVGAAYGVARRWIPLPAPVAAVLLAAGAMAASDGPLIGLGLTDPRTWDPISWLSDAVPHVAYGVAAAAAYELVAG